MVVHSNASLCRERVRDACTDGTWPAFEGLLAATQPGNGGKLGFYYHVVGFYHISADIRFNEEVHVFSLFSVPWF